MTDIISYTAFALFPLTMAYAAVSDLFSLTISNRVSLILIAGFLLVAPFVPGMSWEIVGSHLASGAIVLVVGFTLFSFGWLGGGDAKIAASAALWMGLGLTLEFLVWTTLLGGVLSFVVLTMRSRLLPAFAIRQGWLLRLHDPKTGVPYGIALAGAALIMYPHSIWVGLLAG